MNRFFQMSPMTAFSRKQTESVELSFLTRPWACRVAASKPNASHDMTHLVQKASFLILSH